MRVTWMVLAVLGALAVFSSYAGPENTAAPQTSSTIQETDGAAGETGGDTRETATEPTQSDLQTPGNYTVSEGEAAGLTYAVSYADADGETGGIMSARLLVSEWDGAVFDRESWQQALSGADTWDLVPDGAEITVTLPAGTTAAEVVCDPETSEEQTLDEEDSAVFSPETALETDEAGQLTACTFPVQFTANGKLFCTVRFTLQNGNAGEIAFALSQSR